MALAMRLLSGLLALITTGCGWLLFRLRPRSFALRMRFTSWITIEVEMSQPRSHDIRGAARRLEPLRASRTPGSSPDAGSAVASAPAS